MHRESYEKKIECFIKEFYQVKFSKQAKKRYINIDLKRLFKVKTYLECNKFKHFKARKSKLTLEILCGFF